MTTLYRCTPSLTERDVQALAEFLRETDGAETTFHRLVERHPAIIGALGFVEFVSETRLTKRGLDNQIVHDARSRDRADILAAKLSITTDMKSQKFASIIELKGARDSVLTERGIDRSDTLNHALNQLRRYGNWLVEPANRDALRKFGWEVWNPGKIVIMGSLGNFSHPGQAETLKQELLQSEGVQLILVDELIGLVEAVRRRNEGARLLESFEGIVGLKNHGLESSLIIAEGPLAGLVLAKRILNDAVTPYGNVDIRDGVPMGLVHIDELRLQPLASKLQIPFAEALVDFTGSKRYGWRAVKRGIVVAEFDAPAVLEEIRNRDKRNEGARRRREVINAEKQKQFDAYMQQLRLDRKRQEEEAHVRSQELSLAIQQMFPSLPQKDAEAIAIHATAAHTGRIGTNASFTLAERAWLSVAAYAAYRRLGFSSKKQADRGRQRVLDLLNTWGGPDPTLVLRVDLPQRPVRTRWEYEDTEDGLW